MTAAALAGLTIGLHRSSAGEIVGKVLHVSDCRTPNGPAENAYVYVELTGEGPSAGRCRYLSWVNLFDIEVADRREPGRWALNTPSTAETLQVEWRPFGWDGPIFPNVAH